MIRSSEKWIIGISVIEINKNLLFAEILYLSSKKPTKKNTTIEKSNIIKSL